MSVSLPENRHPRSMTSIAIVALALCGCSSDPELARGPSKGASASADFREGRLSAAEQGWQRALDEDRFAVNVPDAVRHLNNLGAMALYDGRLDEAEARFREALDLCAVEGTDETRGRLRLQLACVKLRRGDLDAAAAELDAAKAWADQGDDADRAHWRALQAGLLLRRGDVSGAEKLARQSLDDAESPEERAAAEVLLGRALENRPEAALAAYQSALDDARDAGHLPLAVEALLGLSRASVADRDAAVRFAKLAHDAARARGFEPGRLAAERALKDLGQ